MNVSGVGCPVGQATACVADTSTTGTGMVRIALAAALVLATLWLIVTPREARDRYDFTRIGLASAAVLVATWIVISPILLHASATRDLLDTILIWFAIPFIVWSTSVSLWRLYRRTRRG